MQKSLWRHVSALALVAVLAAPIASASPLGTRQIGAWWQGAWSWVTSLWEAERYEHADCAWRLADQAACGGLEQRQEAELAWMKASLRADQYRFQEALDLLERARAAAAELPERGMLAKIQLTAAKVFYRDSNLQAAAERLLAVIEFVDAHQSPETALGAMHLLTLCLIDAGEARYAYHYLRSFESAYALAGGMIELRGWWLQARLAMAGNPWSTAIKLLEMLRAEFKERGFDYDAALVTVDLCVCYAKEGQSSAVWMLAQEMYPVFLSMKIPQAASAALILFIDAARARRPRLGELLELAQGLEAIRRRDGR